MKTFCNRKIRRRSKGFVFSGRCNKSLKAFTQNHSLPLVLRFSSEHLRPARLGNYSSEKKTSFSAALLLLEKIHSEYASMSYSPLISENSVPPKRFDLKDFKLKLLSISKCTFGNPPNRPLIATRHCLEKI